MNIFQIFSLLGGLALFLFGMDTMGKALEKQAGSQLEVILSRLTDNRIKGLLLGLVVTAVIQSSSATTVMVVGFVNSGVMKLSQAIGIIMGANVGTTVTAWLLSLTGIKGDSLFIRLLKPSSFSPVLAFIGIVLLMAAKEERRKNIGTILLGFAVLMTGMSTMSAAVEPLSEIPAFTNLFLLFRNPILGMLAGATLTGIIQSSSASVGILQALALSTGAVTYGSAIPIIMGQNIGTCVTAMLSSVGANKSARRTALVHLYFNVIGAVTFLTVFSLLNGLLSFSFVDRAIDAAGIAVVHTTFNLLATLLLLPFTEQLEKLAYLTLPEEEQKEEIQLLDERLLLTPAVALERTEALTGIMATCTQKALLESFSLLESWNEDHFHSVREAEDTVDNYEDQIGDYLVKLTGLDMTERDSRKVGILFQVISDVERMSDHALDIALLAQNSREHGITFSKEAWEELRVLENVVQETMEKTVSLFSVFDEREAQRVLMLHQVIGEVTAVMKEQHIERLQKGECSAAGGFRLNDLLTYLQRVSSHCANIALDLMEAEEGTLHRHARRERSEQEGFSQRYESFRKKYGLDTILPKPVV